MASIKVTSEKENFTSISNNFINFYMPQANGEFVKIYLYLAKLCSTGEDVTICDIADKFNCTDKDICRGVKYWIKQGALRLSYDSEGNVNGITMLTLEEPESSLDDLRVIDFTISEPKRTAITKADSAQVANVTPMISSNEETEEVPNREVPRKVAPTAKELGSHMRDENLQNLISEANAYCGRTIDQKDTNSLIYIYDTLGFSFDLTEYLLEYCAELGKTKFTYIETVAKNWYKEEITTREEAKEYSDHFYSLYGKVLKALGIHSRSVPTNKEKETIKAWVKEFGFTDDIILEGCQVAMDKDPRNASFALVNAILQSWKNYGVKALRDVEGAIKKHQSETRKKPVSAPKASINNFPQADMTDDLLEIEQMYLRKAANSND